MEDSSFLEVIRKCWKSVENENQPNDAGRKFIDRKLSLKNWNNSKFNKIDLQISFLQEEIPKGYDENHTCDFTEKNIMLGDLLNKQVYGRKNNMMIYSLGIGTPILS